MRKIFSYYKKYKIRLIFIVIMKIIGTALDLVIPFLLSYILDKVIPNISNGDLSKVIIYGTAMILCSIVAFVFSFKANQLVSYVGSNCAKELRNDLFIRIQKLSLRQIDDISLPSLISRVSSDTYNENQLYIMILRIGLRAPVLFFGGIIVSLIMNFRLTLILLACIPLIITVIIVVGKFGIPLFSTIQKSLDDLVRTLREDISGIRVIKSLSKENYEKERFAKVNKKVIDYELKSSKIMNTLNPMVTLIMNASLSLIVLFGALLFNQNAEYATSGQIIAFLSYFNIILNSMVAMSRVFIVYSKASASAERINYIIDLPLDLTINSEQEVSPFYIEFKDVSFSYNGKEKNLSDINFTLNKNESLGIIGGTGSGKSTLLNLLMRFYDTDQGTIFVNHLNIKSFNKDELSLLFGSVFQNDILFNMSIKENVDFYRNLNEQDILKAIDSAQANFVYSLEKGIDTILEAKGNNLSGGQKQRLLIARSLAGNPQILIMDDSSSALDYKTDANLRSAIKKEYPNSTMIVVSQRISSIMNCDKILVIDQGKIVNQGSHQELLEKSKIYQDIYSSQMGGDYHA